MNLLLVAAHEYLGLNALQCIHSKQDKIYILGTKRALPLKLSRHCAGYINCDLKDLRKPSLQTIQKIKNYCKKKNIEVLLPTDLDSTLFLSRISMKVGVLRIFPISQTKTLELLNNKWSFFNFLKKDTLPTPQTNLVTKLSDLKKLKMRFPAMIKPLQMQGGEGVVKIHSIENAYEYLSVGNKYNQFPLIAQEYIDGDGIDVSFLAYKGKILAWTVQKNLPDGSIVFIKDSRILHLVEKIVTRSSYSGVAHIDMICERRTNEIKILEFNPRVWGSLLGSKFAGVDFLHLGLSTVENDSAKLKFDYKKASYVTTKNFLQHFLRNDTGKEKDFKKLKNSDLWEMVTDPLPYFACFIQELVS